MKNVLCWVIAFQLFVGCAADPKVVRHLSLSQISNNLDSKNKIAIVTNNGLKSDYYNLNQINFYDSQINLPNNTSIHNQDITAIVEKQKNGRNTIKGLGIGAAAGLVVGSIILALALSSNDDSGYSDTTGLGQGLSVAVGAVSVGAITALGSLLGLGIGALIPKYKTTTYEVDSAPANTTP